MFPSDWPRLTAFFSPPHPARILSSQPTSSQSLLRITRVSFGGTSLEA